MGKLKFRPYPSIGKVKGSRQLAVYASEQDGHWDFGLLNDILKGYLTHSCGLDGLNSRKMSRGHCEYCKRSIPLELVEWIRNRYEDTTV